MTNAAWYSNAKKATDPVLPEPFDDSRRLTGANLYFAGTGAALETAPALAFDEATLERWQGNISVACTALGWPAGETLIRRHRSGASLAFTAPFDQLYAATEVNEWAWWSALPPRNEEGSEEQTFFHSPGHAAVRDAVSALQTLRHLAAAEARPALLTLKSAATTHAVAFLVDDDEVSLGEGNGSRTWFNDELPAPASVPWADLHDIPTALVSGSNGKTTTVRLLAAMTRAHGWATAHSCTDGVFFDGQALETGDFSGPTGARTALRHPGAQAAILETARGGMLRRGLAVEHADAAVVTNIAADHFGEYGIHDLDDLARVKLTVARAIEPQGRLALNADDEVLVRHSGDLACPLGWFSLDFDHPLLVTHRANHGTTCGVREGRLLLGSAPHAHDDLGSVHDMPLTLSGRATYNIANIAAAVLAADALGIASTTIARVLAGFGLSHADNPGRLQQWRFGGVQVCMDYAHNPDGLSGLLKAVGADARTGRLAILLGHAGNRLDDDLRAVASAAAAYHPDHVWLKDIGGYERGRDAGEIPAIMRAQLLSDGIPADAVTICLDETAAARAALAWARGEDMVVLPVHEMEVRTHLSHLLDQMQAQGWTPGSTLP